MERAVSPHRNPNALDLKSSRKVVPLSFETVVQRRLSLAQTLFVLVVIVPVIIAILFFGLIASDRYVSEASFLVRGTSQQSTGGLGALLRTIGLSRADDDTYVVQDFVTSREAVRQLDRRHPLRKIYGRDGIDWFTGFPAFWRRDNFESMYDYYLSRVNVTYNAGTGITTLRVAAFTPNDARMLATSLLKISEELVNRLNARAQRDSIELAQNDVSRAEEKVISSQAAITEFRNRELIIDPNSNSSKSLELVGGLAADLARARTQLQETLSSAPLSPAVQSLRIRAAALQEQITLEQSKLAGKDDALASKMSAYERLVLSREFADRELMLASSSVETARRQARQQHIYIETISPPNLPDESLEPRRWRGFFTTGVFSIAIFAMAWFFAVGSREQLHG